MQVCHLNQALLQSLTVFTCRLVRHMSGTAFGTDLILFYFKSVILEVVKIGGPWTRSMIGGPWTRSMKGVHGPGRYFHGPGPWTRSMEGVRGPGVHVLYFPKVNTFKTPEMHLYFDSDV